MSLCILTIPLYILYELAIVTGSIIEVRKKRKEWIEWDESIQGPKPDKPPTRNKGVWILYLSIIVIVGSLSIFAFQNKKLIEPWIESFRKFGQFSETETTKPSKFKPSTEFQEENATELPILTTQKEFLLQLSPIDENISLEQNQTILFRAQILHQD